MNWTAIFIVLIGGLMIILGWQGTYGKFGTLFSNLQVSGNANTATGGSTSTTKSTVPTTGTQHTAP